MTNIKIATFNLEWMVSAFGGRWKDWDRTIPQTFPGRTLGGIRLDPVGDVPALCRRIAGVIKAVDAKILGYQEGPPLKEQMELFVRDYLNDDYIVFHSNPNWQSVGALVHRSIADKVGVWKPELPDIGKIWEDIPYYPWGKIAEGDRKKHDLARHPLLLRFAGGAGTDLGLMVIHTKSKYSKLKSPEQWTNREPEAILDAIDTRAKISAEVFRIRQFLNHQLDLPNGVKSLLVMGDVNDGPYAEELEEEFMIHSIVDELVGTLLYPDYYFCHAMTPETLRTAASTRFPDPLKGGQIVEELIDHMLISPAIWQKTGAFRRLDNSCQVETQAYEDQFADVGPQRHRELRPSDHKPVSVTVEY